MIKHIEKKEDNTFVYGHDKILSALDKKIQKKKLGHAIIISGKKGIGKSLIAKNFAENLISYKNSCDNLSINKTTKLTNIFYCEKKLIR